MKDNNFLILSKEALNLLFILKIILQALEDLEAQIQFSVTTVCYQKQVYMHIMFFNVIFS